MNDTERLDLPSASSFASDCACPGRQQMIQSLPPAAEIIDVPDDLALRGTRLHQAFQTDNTLDLSEDELEDYEAGVKHCDAIVAQWIADNAIGDYSEGPREHRLWLNDQSTMEPLLSGQLDRFYMAAGHALAVDFKTGRSVGLTPSQRNYQLRVQAVLLHAEFPEIGKIRVALCKPKSKAEPADWCDYTEADLIHAKRDIEHHIWLSSQPDAPRHAGAHCQYCRAKPYCPEAGALAMLPAIMSGITRAPAEANPAALVAQLAPADLVVIWERSAIIGKILDAVKARLKSFPDETLKELGIAKRPGRKLDPIVDTRGLFDKLIAEGISDEAVLSAMRFSKEGLLDALKREKGWSQGAAKGWRDQIIEPFIEKKNAEASLEKI